MTEETPKKRVKKTVPLELDEVGARKIIAICMSWAMKNFDDKEVVAFLEEKLKELTDGPFFNVFDQDINRFLKARKK